MPAAGARPVDLAHLSTYTGGDAALNAEVLQLFVDQAAKLMVQLKSALETGDQKNWYATAHSLKGAARGIGAFAMADAAAEVETVPAASAQQALKALHALSNRAHAVQLFIEAYLDR
ncbi:MAG: Hpt domain-containing protein [Alphaproteobacteria bacterium]|nr:Hpt domain-containing protein [Alphaproteobacteria bacterium]